MKAQHSLVESLVATLVKAQVNLQGLDVGLNSRKLIFTLIILRLVTYNLSSQILRRVTLKYMAE